MLGVVVRDRRVEPARALERGRAVVRAPLAQRRVARELRPARHRRQETTRVSPSLCQRPRRNTRVLVFVCQRPLQDTRVSIVMCQRPLRDTRVLVFVCQRPLRDTRVLVFVCQRPLRDTRVSVCVPPVGGEILECWFGTLAALCWTFARFLRAGRLALGFESGQPWGEFGSYGDRYGGVHVLALTALPATWSRAALEFDVRRHDESVLISSGAAGLATAAAGARVTSRRRGGRASARRRSVRRGASEPAPLTRQR
jgi:hypothetical protein